MTDQKKVAPAAGIAALVAAAVTLSVPMTASFEGFRAKPYSDPAGILTVCYGETERAMRIYTEEECKILLQVRQEHDYAPQVLRCVPAFSDPRRRPTFAASIDFAYNGGIASFCRSSMARAFNAGRWRDGCVAFLLYDKARVNGRLTVLRGLANRRAAELALCLKGV